jgi:TPR repeat protein
VPKDDVEAVNWWRKAAEQGYARAQFSLGVMYDKGTIVPEDDAEAVKWYRKAAQQGVANAQAALGNMYAQGEGVPENFVQAYAWLNLAAAQSFKPASGNKDIVRKNMTPAQIAEAQKLSKKLCVKIPGCVR